MTVNSFDGLVKSQEWVIFDSNPASHNPGCVCVGGGGGGGGERLGGAFTIKKG